ncbi:MAG TPA: dCTP deaminase [Patescibacteria group bacterium]|nr:dCTP deaminase [Patescibacteria group bacterium]
MLLSHDAIVAALQKGIIKISPTIGDSQIGGASVDLRLSNMFRIFKKVNSNIPVLSTTDYKNYTQEVQADTFLLSPQQTILGITLEKITLPEDICAWIEGRSRFARLGLLIHISAGLIQPGVDNQQVLEMTNLGPNSLELHAGECICQLVFQRVEGKSTYKGLFAKQTAP